MSRKQRLTHLSALFIGCALLPVSSFAQLSFQPSQPAQISSASTVTFHGDFNKDGREDLIVTNDSTIVDYLYLSNGNGTYQAPITLPALVQAIGDFNGDGKLDYAIYK